VSQTLPKHNILKGRNNYSLVFREGKSVTGKVFRCLHLCDARIDARGGSGLLFSVAVSSRSVKRAIDRNRIKRLVREAYRRHPEVSGPLSGHSPETPRALIFVYRPGAVRSPRLLSYREVETDILHILSRLQSAITPAVS
jgi:ribonuclease P protein component